MRDENDPFNLPDRGFIDLFRLNKDLVSYLFRKLVPHMSESLRVTKITREIRIFIALRFFCTGNYQRGIGEEFLLSSSQQVVSRCIVEVSEAITENISEEWIIFPTTEERKLDIKRRGFMEKAGFLGIIGCIDCTHVAILAPTDQEHNYVNRKEIHSKHVQIVCSFNLEILSERNTWLIGDSGYPLQPWLLTPFENPLPDTPESRYNYDHKITRSDVERYNAYFKERFRCVSGERNLRYAPDKVGRIVNSCAILHNMCIRAGIEIIIDEFEKIDVPNGNEYVPNVVLNEGRQVQQDVVNRYFR
ncbi:hypothetical protein NQ314_008443 [Rhamnusium bicolor]|uniref:DDE Tnp4 domain-containing protein n=1 Tax=Rhamnusium bicolor TaxID=1586634 RepID=A0AAV8YAG4_9CUCU|nr:hypothetical protein NQ314_008443 [Rhamnusium bicolor]